MAAETPPRRTDARPARRLAGLALLVAAALVAGPAVAQDVSINLGQGAGVNERVIQLIALITVLSVAPSILIMVTSFVRIAVVLSLLRTAIGTQTAPPNAVIVGLSLFLTGFVMAPTLQQSYDLGIRPLIENQIDAPQAFERASGPFRDFMLKHVREKDLALFQELSREAVPATPQEVSFRVLVPAFMISELRRSFEIGFLIILPFLVIDMIVATLTMSMGMMMMPPTILALPFKMLFFVLIDGWNLLASGLVRSFS